MQVSLLQAILQTEEIKRRSALTNQEIAGLSPAKVNLFNSNKKNLFFRLIPNKGDMTAEIGGI